MVSSLGLSEGRGIESPLSYRPFFGRRGTHGRNVNLPKREEVKNYTVLQRVKKTLNCKQVLVATEPHKEEGLYSHAAVLNESASKHTAGGDVFPEFDGMQCHVSFSSSSVGIYVLKKDQHPMVWALWTYFGNAANKETKKGRAAEHTFYLMAV